MLLWAMPGCTPDGLSSPQQQTSQSQAQANILSQLKSADIIYLAENHDSAADHQAQLDIISQLYQNKTQIAIALEMFQRPYQGILDQYLAGDINEEQLREKSEYDQRWGFDWELYAPIFRFAKAHKLPLLALNTPTEITRKVAREGLESLTKEELTHIPPLSEIRTDNAEYRSRIEEIYQQHAHGGHGNSDSFERFFTAQVLWDETMAEKIAQFHQANPNYQIVVLAGKNHIAYGHGIPSRVTRRVGLDSSQVTVWLGSFQGEKLPTDYLWEY